MLPSSDIQTLPKGEFLQFPHKVQSLINEFKLPLPNESTYKELLQIFDRGLPFIKSVSRQAFESFVDKGELKPDEHEVVYAAVSVSKQYGSFSLITTRTPMMSGNFKAYCVDHGSYYISNKVQEKIRSLAHQPSASELNEFSREIEKEIMKQYTLTPEEFRIMYAFCVSGLADYESADNEEALLNRPLRESTPWDLITFDIGLPFLRKEDISAVFYKDGWGGTTLDEMKELLEKAKGTGIRCFTLDASLNNQADQDARLTEITFRQKSLNIPEKFWNPMRRVG